MTKAFYMAQIGHQPWEKDSKNTQYNEIYSMHYWNIQNYLLRKFPRSNRSDDRWYFENENVNEISLVMKLSMRVKNIKITDS